MSDIKIHPAAECVRLMDAEELASLAASIAANGLREPIELGRVNGAETEMLVNGRNRLRACEIAGVEPHFTTIEFEDDEAVKRYVADKSEHRNITKGQKAMRLALLWPEPDRGRGKKDEARKGAEISSLSYRRVQQARQVLHYSRELAEAVREGKPLDEALEDVNKAKQALENDQTRMARLKDEAHDLADLVEEGRMKLNEAIAAHDERKAEAAKIEESKRETMIRVVSSAYSNILALVPSFVEDVNERLDDQTFRAELLKYTRFDAEQFNSIKAGAAALTKLVDKLKQGGK